MGKAARRFFAAVFGLFGACHVHGQSNLETCAIDPTAIVSDACASFSTLDSLNAELQPTIRSLTHDSDFFSYYRLNLFNKECPFWSDEGGLCGNIACAVNTIDNEEDIPLTWRAEELGKLEGPKAQHPSRKMQQEAKPLMGGLGDAVGESCVVEYDDECDDRDYCVPEDESATAKGDYVSLVDNPERFTGYGGESAHQVWEAIYRENCFPRESDSVAPAPVAGGSPSFLKAPAPQRQAAQDLRSVIREHSKHQNLVPGSLDSAPNDEDLSFEDDEQCLEKRVFYRIISGMHASISTHLCYDYLNQSSGQWGPNVTCYTNRLHTHPDRISNLYFNYALVLRAVSKLRPTFSRYTFCSGDSAQDALTKRKIIALADQITAGPRIYDESLMFREAGLKEDFRNRFRNVSRTMDCVGCDKCRLWGKLQTAGYGTALKVLFESTEESDEPLLRRTELVALLNTLDKLSHSLSAIGVFEEMIAKDQHHADPSPKERNSPRSAPAISVSSASGATIVSSSVPAPDDDTDADFYPSSHNETPLREYNPVIESEFVVVWNTVKWVISSWIDIPSNFFHIAVMQMSAIWDFWLGRATSIGRAWEVRFAPGIQRLARNEL